MEQLPIRPIVRINNQTSITHYILKRHWHILLGDACIAKWIDPEPTIT